MKKSLTLSLLLSLVISVFPAFAQKRVEKTLSDRTKSENQFDSHLALTDGNGVLIRWQMKTETGVVGYKVFRSTSTGTSRINDNLILGSVARYRDDTAYGELYDFYDLSGEAGDSYYVEGVTSDGSRFESKNFEAARVRNLESEVGTSSAAFRAARMSTNSNIEERTSSLTGELRDLVSLHEQVADPVQQLWVAAQPGAKIAVKKDGFYRVSAAELQTANFPVHGDSSKWRLFTNGVEQSIIVGPNDQYIEFYGKGIDTPDSDKRIYYLIADVVPGKRIGTKVLRQIPGSAAATRYQVSTLKKERTGYSDRFRNGDEENFLGRVIESSGTQINLNLPGADPTAQTAEIKLNLYGYREGFHEVEVSINGNLLPLITQYGYVFYDRTFTIPGEYLTEGTNALELRSRLTNDSNLFDKVEVRYTRKYQADENKLSFSTPGGKKVEIPGFTTSNVRVFDTTFEGNPVLISNVSLASQGSEYTARIPSGRTMVGYAIEDSALMQVSAITENIPSTIASSTNAADMVIISHSNPGFLNAAENWASYRRSAAGGGFTVKVVDIADVYDEFGYGQPGAEFVRSFLKHASTEWATAPRYVLLVGDASYDPRNYEGYGFYDFVPSRNVTLIFTESPSDDAVVDFDDDGFAELAIGRIPARRPEQIASALSKTIAYESNQQTFGRGVLFAYDSAGDVDFAGMSQQLAQQLLPSTPRLFSSVADDNAHAILVNRMNDGKFLINYSGHGAAGIWANSTFFNLNSVPELANSTNPSVYTMLTCLNGYFIAPNRDSISEQLLLAENGGAAAAWASTTTTTPNFQILMGTRFYNQLAHGSIERLGDLVMDAKTVVPGSTDVRMSWLLFGDPALKMP